MPKLKSTNGLKKVDLSDIEIRNNSRKQFVNIEELAASIEQSGQIQPVVLESKPEGGYILTAGERRFRAHEFLVSQGKPYNQIEAVIRTGNREILQLVENVNRENLTAQETELAIRKLIDSGMTQKEISDRTGKRIQWVSDILAAEKTRERVESEGVDTSGMSSSALSLLRNQDTETIKETAEAGGSVKEATSRVKKKKAKAVEPSKDQQHQAFHEGQILYDEKGNKVAVVVSADGETGTVKEVKE